MKSYHFSSNFSHPQIDWSADTSTHGKVPQLCNIIDINQNKTIQESPNTTCGCGRPSNHILKQGIIFSNFVILKNISKSLEKQDLQSLKIAFSNYRLIEYFLHDFVCKGNIKNLDLRCECRHKAEIVTI